jgi:hypothetical protein
VLRSLLVLLLLLLLLVQIAHSGVAILHTISDLKKNFQIR